MKIKTILLTLFLSIGLIGVIHSREISLECKFDKSDNSFLLVLDLSIPRTAYLYDFESIPSLLVDSLGVYVQPYRYKAISHHKHGLHPFTKQTISVDRRNLKIVNELEKDGESVSIKGQCYNVKVQKSI